MLFISCRSLSSAALAVAVLCCVVDSSPACAADPPASVPADSGAAADALTKKAVDALKRDAPAEAEKYAREAWALKQSYDIASNLGLAELGLKKHRDAAEHLAYALRFFPANGKPEHKKLLDVSFEKAKAEVAAITVRVSIDRAAVTVDGKAAGAAPLAGPLFLEPGEHTIEARLEGYKVASAKVQAAKGGASDVTLTLEQLSPPAPSGTAMAATSATSTATAPHPEPAKLPAYIAFGVGGAGLLAGLVTGALTVAKTSQLGQTCARPDACPTSARGDLDEANALANVSNVGFVVAGVGAAVGTTLFIMSSRRTSAKASFVIGPAFVSVKGNF